MNISNQTQIAQRKYTQGFEKGKSYCLGVKFTK